VQRYREALILLQPIALARIADCRVMPSLNGRNTPSPSVRIFGVADRLAGKPKKTAAKAAILKR
jgi:hypothetical protein